MMSNPSFALAAPTSNSAGGFTYYSNNTSVATISGTTVTLVGPGISIITAVQAANGIYRASSISAVLTVGLGSNTNPVITNFNPISKFVSDSPFAIGSPTSTSTSSFTYFSSMPSINTINGSTTTLKGTGIATISAIQPAIGSFNTGSISTTLTVTNAPPAISYTSSNIFTKGVTISNLSPVSTGGAPYTSGGLILNPTTGTISGTPSLALAATTFTITGSNSGGSTTATISITVTDEDPTSLEYSTPIVLFKGVIITPLTPSNSGGAITDYTINPSLPAGLTLNPSTGVITGRPTVPSPETNYDITGTNSGGSDTFTISILVNDNEPTDLSYSTPSIFEVGVAITPLTPTVYGGAVTRYSIDHPLPTGLNFNTTTGVISGTPSQITATATYIVTAFNFMGRSSASIEITIGGPATNLSYGGNLTVAKNATMTAVTPTINSTTSVTYSLSPSLPDGLVFDAVSGQISGTPTTIQTAQSYTVTASNGFAPDATVTFTIAVVDVPVINYTTPSNYTDGVAISNLTPSVSGLTPITFSITPNLPDGLLFDTTTGTISGTPHLILRQLTIQSRLRILWVHLRLAIADAAVAEATATTITIKGAGNTVITVNQAETATHQAASTTFTLTVNKRAANLAIQDITKKYAGSEVVAINLTTLSSGSISYVVTDPTIASISGNNLTILKSGSTLITATQTSDNNHLSDTDEFTLTINKADLLLTPSDNQNITGEVPAFTGSLGRVSGTAIGTYDIQQGTIAVADNGAFKAENYTLGFTTGKKFEISSKNIDGGDFTISTIADLDYTGLAQEPTFQILDGSTALVNNLDYTFVYSNNLNAGNATVQLTGKGNYSGTNSKTFLIKKIPLRVEVDTKTKVYGNPDPALTAKYIGFVNNETESVLGANYVIERVAGEDVNNYIISANGYLSENYTVTSVPNNFTITKKDVSDQDIAVADISGLEYKASAHQVEPLIKQGSRTMVKDADHTLEYANNTFPGTATLTIKGIGNYSGTRTVSFTIAKRTIQVQIARQTKDFGQPDPNLIYTISPNLYGTDVLTGNIKRLDGEIVGLYAISLETLSAGANYNLVIQGDAKFQIVSVDTDKDGVPDADELQQGNYIENRDGTSPDAGSEFKDSDADGVPDYIEDRDGSDSNNPLSYIDTDKDGIPDYIEVRDQTDPTDKLDYKDTDKDGVPDYIENRDGTSPDAGSNSKIGMLTCVQIILRIVMVQIRTILYLIDTDKDGVPDYIEVRDQTDPTDKLDYKDTDKDGVPDYQENIDKTNPNAASEFMDTDSDGVPDYIENRDGSDSNNPLSYIDTDKDGVPDYLKYVIKQIQQINYIEKRDGTSVDAGSEFKDTDGDGVPDYIEEQQGTDPNDKSDFKDSDGDGVPDYIEEQQGTDSNNSTDAKDSDKDGVPDYIEEKQGTNPNNSTDSKDSDADGVPDYIEEQQGTDLKDANASKDTDNDGIPDYIEDQQGTDPNNPTDSKDSDGDGIADFIEEQQGTNQISNELKTKEVFDFEKKSSYSLRIRTTDAGSLSYEKSFTINIKDVNEAPTKITASKLNIYEGNSVDELIGLLSTTDEDAGDAHTYSLVSGSGSTDNAAFKIVNGQLRAAQSFKYASKNSYSIRIRTTDKGGLSTEQQFIISISEKPLITGTGNETYPFTRTAASSNPSISLGYISQLNNAYMANPAMAGINQGIRLNLGYRNQWSNIQGSPKNLSVSGEYGSEKDDAGLLSRTKLQATYAYRLQLNNEDAKLHFGISLGLQTNNLNLQNVVGSQNDQTAIRYNDQENIIDGDFGIAYTDQRIRIEGAFSNLKNQLKIEDNQISDYATFLTSITYKAYLSDWYLNPKVVYRGVKNFDDMVDMGLELRTPDDQLGHEYVSYK
ncbi:hypothetical protein GHT06_004498 [Daphnia sinensis]|uniref:Cadherin domain-containing protein n=1 Tax=Daphnia sinensis TaxID=1820382 RepID=A0AAD5PLS3_9CRUS|nr:hypothetical protein GHT06_004498 [Daphnia sinensis]